MHVLDETKLRVRLRTRFTADSDLQPLNKHTTESNKDIINFYHLFTYLCILFNEQIITQ